MDRKDVAAVQKTLVDNGFPMKPIEQLGKNPAKLLGLTVTRDYEKVNDE